MLWFIQQMHSLIELLQQAQKELSCPTCGRGFQLGEIRPRGRIKNNLMLQAVCANNHFPVVIIFIPNKPFNVQLKAISKKDTDALALRLSDFNGDFASLWKQNSAK